MKRLTISQMVIYFVFATASSLLAGEMDGEWISISRIRAGEQLFEGTSHARIQAGKFMTIREGVVREQGTLIEHADVIPNSYSVDMSGDAPDAGKSYNGIFIRSADTMITCANPHAGGTKPSEFRSTKENGYLLLVWQRKTAVNAETDRQEASDGAGFERVYHFIAKNAVNRTMLRSSEGMMDGGKLAYEFRREATLCNLVKTESRFTYDVIYVIKQKNWDLQGGKKIGEPRTQDRILVTRYEFGHRKSTGEIIGTSSELTSTRDNWGGSNSMLSMKLDGDRLNVEVSTSKYLDYFDRGGKYYPGASATNEVWSVVDGKLVREAKSKTYRVDPKTGNREKMEGDDENTNETEIVKLPLE